MLLAFFWLFALQLLGEVIVRLLHLPVPGPVLGMAFLALLFSYRARWFQSVKPVAAGLLSHLSLLFVPAGVGLMVHGEMLLAVGWKLLLVLVLSTVFGLLACAAVIRVGTYFVADQRKR